MRLIASLLVCAAILPAQQRTREPASSRVKDSDKGSWVQGTVINDVTGRPLNRAYVTLKPITGSSNGVVVETDEHGRFVMSRIAPGTYALEAQRDGFLPASNIRRGALRLPPLVELKDNLRVRDLEFRLRPWAVVSGRIRFDDGEPAVGAAVQFFREVINRGRHTMQVAASVRANDHGEYRAHGLTPGAYIVAALRNRAVSGAFEEQERVDERGRPVSEWRYATTFYPQAQKLEDAVAVHVTSAQELDGIDIDLKPVPSVRIHGRVTNGLTGQPVTPAPVEFRRMTADGKASIGVPVDVKPAPNDGFEISGVTAGPYMVIARSQYDNQRLVAARYLLVSDAALDNLDLLLEPEREMTGVVRIEDLVGAPRLSALRVVLEPRSDLNPGATAQVREDGTFRVKVTAGETYDVYVTNMPVAAYVKSVRIGNMDVGADGVPGSAASATVPVEVRISGRSGMIYGRAYLPAGGMAGGINVVAVPDPVQGRFTTYAFTNADEYGAFFLAGLAPGRYTVFTYYDDPPCDLYDESALAGCRATGKTVDAGEGTQASIEVRLR